MYGPVRTVVWQGSVGNRRPYADQVLVLYRKREQARRAHEHGVFARFRYNDLKEAGRGCGGRGRYGNSMMGKSSVGVG